MSDRAPSPRQRLMLVFRLHHWPAPLFRAESYGDSKLGQFIPRRPPDPHFT
jgi:hypothetical protein